METSSIEFPSSCFETPLMFQCQIFPDLESLDSDSLGKHDEMWKTDKRLKEVERHLEDHDFNIAHLFNFDDGILDVKSEQSRLKDLNENLEVEKYYYDEQLKDQASKSATEQEEFDEQHNYTDTTLATKQDHIGEQHNYTDTTLATKQDHIGEQHNYTDTTLATKQDHIGEQHNYTDTTLATKQEHIDGHHNDPNPRTSFATKQEHFEEQHNYTDTILATKQEHFDGHHNDPNTSFATEQEHFEEQHSSNNTTLATKQEHFEEQHSSNNTTLATKQEHFEEQQNHSDTTLAKKQEHVDEDVKDQISELDDKLSSHGRTMTEISSNTQESKQTLIKESGATTTSDSNNELASTEEATRDRTFLSVSQKKLFTARVPHSNHSPCMMDAKLLTTELVLLADWSNSCVALFDTEGQHINTLHLDLPPACIAMMDLDLPNCWRAAVSSLERCCIYIVEIILKGHALSLKARVQTLKQYCALTAVDSETLAAGWLNGAGLDIIDLSGTLLRTLSSDVEPVCMVTTLDRCLVLSDNDKTLVKLNLKQGTFVFKHEVPQLTSPFGVSTLRDGSYVVADSISRTLHLVSPGGTRTGQLWEHPEGGHSCDYLSSVAVTKEICVCCTIDGSVFVLVIGEEEFERVSLHD